jgi:hypothetical protein
MEFLPTSEPIAALAAAREMASKFGATQRKQSSNETLSGRSYATA